MTMQAETKKIYTPEEYLELEVNSDIRSEYRNREIIPMTGGTPNHNDIAGNLYILLKSSLKGKIYHTFYVDQRLWIPSVNLYTYPDVMVIPKPLEFQMGRKDTLLNPCVIAEVLSKSTQNYDRSEKFIAYRTIPTFREYLLIDQYRIYVEHYVQTSPHQWLFSEHDDPTGILTLSTVEMQIQIADLYENIDFSDG
jgi:Uma2 family endonuclease